MGSCWNMVCIRALLFFFFFNFYDLPLLTHLFFSSVTKCICVSKMSHALCSSSGSPTQDSLGPKLLYSLSLLYVLSVHRLNMGTRASQTTVLHGAALPRYSTSATQTEAVGRQHFSASKRGGKDKSFRLGFCSNMPRSCDHNPFFHSLCFPN